jgi:hypothetical protein
MFLMVKSCVFFAVRTEFLNIRRGSASESFHAFQGRGFVNNKAACDDLSAVPRQFNCLPSLKVLQVQNHSKCPSASFTLIETTDPQMFCVFEMNLGMILFILAYLSKQGELCSS